MDHYSDIYNDIEVFHIPQNTIYIGHKVIDTKKLWIIYSDVINLRGLRVEDDAFEGLDFENCLLMVPPSVVNDYKSNNVFRRFINISPNPNIMRCSSVLISEVISALESPIYDVISTLMDRSPVIDSLSHNINHTYHGYQLVASHYRSGYWRNGHWVSGCYVRSHSRYY